MGYLNWQYRFRDPKYFRLYSSYVDAQFMEKNGENHRVLGFWQTRKFKLLLFMGFVLACCAGLLIYLFSSTTSALDSLTNKKEPQQIEHSQSNPSLSIPSRFVPSNADIEPAVCYESVWVNNGVVTYKLNNGHYAYNPSYLIERCSRIFTKRTDKNL